MPLILITTSPRVAPGLLGHDAWRLLREGRTYTGSAGHPCLPYLAEAGVQVEVIDPEPSRLVAEARQGQVVWLAAQDGDADVLRAVGQVAVGQDDPPVIEVVPGSYDLPGARVLDLVGVMDRLRNECPWDAKQTHETLVPYLLEEAYEVQETVEDGDYPALREELGDVLLQVAFHSRLAMERDDGFDIDDVAAGIVDKLVRRHPHVFGSVEVGGEAEVTDNWEVIKAAERAAKGKESVLDGVPLGQPSLTLAAKLQSRAERIGAPADLPGEGVSALGARLFELVRQARAEGLDPEAELRAAARAYRDRVRAWERTTG
ncbi:nucleoside triphosphate pyrophosphohydrolase [Spongiactinospora rosea]|uniref:Nucleoside triphosphate pyrophosphohydrolase n=1 Tax=Spongiactinospora rosea TaxID=2248750 RepID=A0A366LYP1_9ACTN|nr:MazG family protein [Spongiactinospora rosea]RBQ18700.1 nucleoside triphosphate pyrophosphohydrolase [Spongiactinospora rosea]